MPVSPEYEYGGCIIRSEASTKEDEGDQFVQIVKKCTWRQPDKTTLILGIQAIYAHTLHPKKTVTFPHIVLQQIST